MKFPLSKLATRLCKGVGLEIGAAAHNPFGLNTQNVSYEKEGFWTASEIKTCGESAKVDIVAEGDNIPLPDESQDFIIHSHVLEHMANPIKALKEWFRLVKPGGILFMIVPKRDALPSDKDRPITLPDEFLQAYEKDFTVETLPEKLVAASYSNRGHLWRFTMESLKLLIEQANSVADIEWIVFKEQPTDDKAGNGHTVVCKKSQDKTPKPKAQAKAATKKPAKKKVAKKKPVKKKVQVNKEEDIVLADLDDSKVVPVWPGFEEPEVVADLTPAIAGTTRQN